MRFAEDTDAAGVDTDIHCWDPCHDTTLWRLMIGSSIVRSRLQCPFVDVRCSGTAKVTLQSFGMMDVVGVVDPKVPRGGSQAAS